ncbi:hypothetical protein DIPPA_02433 [Diplonema papillatum]|nr:hypothetical protein DIPPA_02433 [Diplonema papillatum]|eukprot:gene21565-33179_t
MPYVASVEVVVNVLRYVNVDLLSQGLYFVSVGVKGQGAVGAVGKPYDIQSDSPCDSQRWRGLHAMGIDHACNKTNSKCFMIRYLEQEENLQELSRFVIHLDALRMMEQHGDTIEITAELHHIPKDKLEQQAPSATFMRQRGARYEPYNDKAAKKISKAIAEGHESVKITQNEKEFTITLADMLEHSQAGEKRRVIDAGLSVVSSDFKRVAVRTIPFRLASTPRSEWIPLTFDNWYFSRCETLISTSITGIRHVSARHKSGSVFGLQSLLSFSTAVVPYTKLSQALLSYLLYAFFLLDTTARPAADGRQTNASESINWQSLVTSTALHADPNAAAQSSDPATTRKNVKRYYYLLKELQDRHGRRGGGEVSPFLLGSARFGGLSTSTIGGSDQQLETPNTSMTGAPGPPEASRPRAASIQLDDVSVELTPNPLGCTDGRESTASLSARAAFFTALEPGGKVEVTPVWDKVESALAVDDSLTCCWVKAKKQGVADVQASVSLSRWAVAEITSALSTASRGAEQDGGVVLFGPAACGGRGNGANHDDSPCSKQSVLNPLTGQVFLRDFFATQSDHLSSMTLRNAAASQDGTLSLSDTHEAASTPTTPPLPPAPQEGQYPGEKAEHAGHSPGGSAARGGPPSSTSAQQHRYELVFHDLLAAVSSILEDAWHRGTRFTASSTAMSPTSADGGAAAGAQATGFLDLDEHSAREAFFQRQKDVYSACLVARGAVRSPPECPRYFTYPNHTEVTIREVEMDSTSDAVVHRHSPATSPSAAAHRERPVTGVDHLMVFVHGWKGNSCDLSEFKNYLQLYVAPGTEYHCVESMEATPNDSIRALGENVAKEVAAVVQQRRSRSLSTRRLTFVGHSMGCIVIRAALQAREMEPLLTSLYTYISLAGPHLGIPVSNSKRIGCALGLLSSVQRSANIRELRLDSALLHALSSNDKIGMFKHVLLFASEDDQFVGPSSALARTSVLNSTQSSCDGFENKVPSKRKSGMVRDIARNMTASTMRCEVYRRFHVSFKPCGRAELTSRFDRMVGKSVHIAFLVDVDFMHALINNFLEYLE